MHYPTFDRIPNFEDNSSFFNALYGVSSGFGKESKKGGWRTEDVAPMLELSSSQTEDVIATNRRHARLRALSVIRLTLTIKVTDKTFKQRAVRAVFRRGVLAPIGTISDRCHSMVRGHQLAPNHTPVPKEAAWACSKSTQLRATPIARLAFIKFYLYALPKQIKDLQG